MRPLPQRGLGENLERNPFVDQMEWATCRLKSWEEYGRDIASVYGEGIEKITKERKGNFKMHC